MSGWSNPAIPDLLQGKWPVCSDGGMIVCTVEMTRSARVNRRCMRGSV